MPVRTTHSRVPLCDAHSITRPGGARAGGNNCPRGDEIFTQADCEAAAKQLVHTFGKPINDNKSRPHGCFWDQAGKVYFNEATCCYDGDWGGIGGMCKGVKLEAKGWPWLFVAPAAFGRVALG